MTIAAAWAFADFHTPWYIEFVMVRCKSCPYCIQDGILIPSGSVYSGVYYSCMPLRTPQYKGKTMTITRLIISAGMVLLLTACSSTESSGPVDSDTTRLKQIDAMYQEYREDFLEVKEITSQGVADLQKSGELVLVDVREPEEQSVSMIPGAITAEAFEVAQETYRDKTVVTYCTIGARSGVYADALRQKGINVSNLKGSLLAWTHAGLPLKDAEGHDTKRVHVYGKKWDLVAEGYEAIW